MENILTSYKSVIFAINNGIKEFSEYLIPECRISPFDEQKLADTAFTSIIKDVPWERVIFPSYQKHGVYFLLGRSKINEKEFVVYVGKASYNSKIGSRLNVHFKNSEKEKMIYSMGNYSLEVILTIPLEEALHFLAPAIEEYIIYNLQIQQVKVQNIMGKL